MDPANTAIASVSFLTFSIFFGPISEGYPTIYMKNQVLGLCEKSLIKLHTLLFKRQPIYAVFFLFLKQIF